MLFNPKHRKKVELVWKIVCLIVVVGMILLYVPTLF
jgi:hypothetical protein